VAATTHARRAPADKHDERRDQLAESALRTLGERGYARTSLREIANNSEFSHGVVHYYFADKHELIVYCVRHYKARCVTRYDDVVASSTTEARLLDAFAAKLVESVQEEGALHCVWYDLRSQSLFEESLREAVAHIDATLKDMTWRVVTKYAALAGRPPAMSPATAYGVLDGLFQQALFGHRSGDASALPTLVEQVHDLVPLTLVAASGPQARPVDAVR
jgi:TetR/AcrR family transcriptional repressor of bet genes